MRSIKKNMDYWIIGLLGYWVIGLAGCGYTTRSAITQDYSTIYVSPFENKIDITTETSIGSRYKTYHPLLENDIRREVIDEFVRDGNLRIAKEEEADLILKGELVDYRRDALRYTDSDNEEVEEYRISLVVNLELWDNSGEQSLWKTNNFIGESTYFLSGSLKKSESSAINAAVDDLARRTVELVVEAW
ncbi:MAG: hypothetical protein ISS45_01625 [Candidatus Omnitrophica bacterium]|nr:hypothetical protein [Candidatus Omnitrophota bacterium]